MDEAAHCEAPHSASSHGSRFSLLVYVPVLLLIYLLGTGPAAWVSEKFPATEDVMGLLYSPVSFVAEKCHPLGKAMHWYVTAIWRVDD